MHPRLIGVAIKRWCCLTSDVCLSRTSGPKSRRERPRKTKIGTEVAHVTHMTRTPLSRSKGQRSRSPYRSTHRGVYTSGNCSGHRGNVFTVGTYCYVAICRRGGRLGGARRFGAHRGGEGRGISWRPPAYSLLNDKESTGLWHVALKCNNV